MTRRATQGFLDIPVSRSDVIDVGYVNFDISYALSRQR